MSPTESYYAAHAEELKATERARRQAQAKRVSEDELERLRLPQFRLETLDYGADHQLVCLWCGYLADRALARHVSACPKMPLAVKAKLQVHPQARASDAYKEDWGYNTSNPLMSQEEIANRKASRKSERFQKAFSERIAPAFAAKRAEQSAARQNGGKPKRGSMRLESRMKREGVKLGRRLDRDALEKVRQELRKDLPLAQSAKNAGLSENKFWRLAQMVDPTWGSRRNKERRAVIRRYLFALRRSIWQQQAHVNLDWVSTRHTDGLIKGEETFRDFEPFFPTLLAEMREHPWYLKNLGKVKTTSAGLVSAEFVVKLTAQVLERHNRERIDGVEAAQREQGVVAGPKSKRPAATRRKRPSLRLTPQMLAALDSLGLTERQKEVAVERYGYGRGIREIARKLRIDHKAVTRHLSAIKKKAQKKCMRLG